jgi:hypothetical protein
MSPDPKRELLRHLIATIVFRWNVAIADAPSEFYDFKIDDSMRTPREILAHIGDLLEGSLMLMKGELVYLNSKPLEWTDEVSRFIAAAAAFDAYLAGNEPLHQPIEKITQGPIADALTHIGQVILLRRAAGFPVRSASYFEADIVSGELDQVLP